MKKTYMKKTFYNLPFLFVVEAHNSFTDPQKAVLPCITYAKKNQCILIQFGWWHYSLDFYFSY